MEAALAHIRDQQQQTWDTFSPGWRKWDSWTMNFLRPMGTKIIEALHIQPTDQVLDIATGTGEPGLSIARRGVAWSASTSPKGCWPWPATMPPSKA